MLNSLLLNETCKFKLKPSKEHRAILEDLFKAYTEMVKICLDNAMCFNITSRQKLHNALYRDLRSRYSEYPSHYIYTAITCALAIFRSYRRRKKGSVSPPNIRNLNLNIRSILLDDTHLFWFYWGSLRLSTHRGHITIPFKVHEHAKKFIGWQVKGSRLVKDENNNFHLHVSFRNTVEEGRVDGILGIDINEKSIDLAIVKLNKVKFIKIDIAEAKYIRDRYFRKRRSIQSKSKSKGKGKTSGETKDTLLAKYSGRERRRVNEILHKASKLIAKIVAEENVKPVMENLKDIRERIQYGSRMNRRLHTIPFRKVQSYISYKSIEKGFEPEYVSAKNTSRRCPICGKLSKPNGHLFKCGECGFQADRHLTAAWNIATRLSMWGALPLPPKATEAFKAEVERIVIKN
ncbi:MAG: RNA-guided endonuclease InsQ/TnpB family protein [Candidatus Nitrosocaldus sp.]